MMIPNTPHNQCVNELDRRFGRISTRSHVPVQYPLRIQFYAQDKTFSKPYMSIRKKKMQHTTCSFNHLRNHAPLKYFSYPSSLSSLNPASQLPRSGFFYAMETHEKMIPLIQNPPRDTSLTTILGLYLPQALPSDNVSEESGHNRRRLSTS